MRQDKLPVTNIWALAIVLLALFMNKKETRKKFNSSDMYSFADTLLEKVTKYDNAK